jgi:O-antigen/teichoic acid export membrane protein
MISNLLLYLGHLIIARRLPRDDYAIFVVVVSFVSLAALFADLGLTGLFIRKFAEAEAIVALGKKDRRGELLGSILGLRIGLAVIISIVVMLITPLLGYPLETRHLILIMLVTFFISSRLVVVRSVGEAFLRGANKYHVVALLAMIDALTFTSVLYFYSGKTLNLERAVWIYSFCHLPGFILLFAIIYRDAKSVGFHLQFRLGLVRSMIRESLPLILSTVFLTIHSQADPLLLDKLSSPKEVSAFGAGMRVLSAIIFLPAVFSAVIGPPVTQATITKDFDKIRSTMDRSLRLLLTCALFVAIILTVSSDTVMNVLFGAGKYSDAAPLVTMFGWTFILICFAAFITDIAIAEGKFWISVLFTSVIMFTSIGSNLLLIPQYGALGSALAKLISVSLGCIVLLYSADKLYVLARKQILLLFLRLASVAACSFFAMYILSILGIPSLGILCLVILLFFVNVIFLFKIISFQEILMFISGLRANPNREKI